MSHVASTDLLKLHRHHLSSLCAAPYHGASLLAQEMWRNTASLWRTSVQTAFHSSQGVEELHLVITHLIGRRQHSLGRLRALPLVLQIQTQAAGAVVHCVQLVALLIACKAILVLWGTANTDSLTQHLAR